MTKKKVKESPKTVLDLISESTNLTARINKAQDTIARMNDALRIITIKSSDEEIQGIVDLATEQVEYMNKLLTTRIESWEIQKKEINEKEV